jgi:hypothetical protein
MYEINTSDQLSSTPAWIGGGIQVIKIPVNFISFEIIQTVCYLHYFYRMRVVLFVFKILLKWCNKHFIFLRKENGSPTGTGQFSDATHVFTMCSKHIIYMGVFDLRSFSKYIIRYVFGSSIMCSVAYIDYSSNVGVTRCNFLPGTVYPSGAPEFSPRF